MSNMVGGSLEQMQVLEQQFTTDAQTVGELQRRISSAVANTTWTGRPPSVSAASGTAPSSRPSAASRRPSTRTP